MSRTELRISREMPVAGGAVVAVANDPATYPKWVAPLRSLDQSGKGTYAARLGYMFCERTLNCTWTRKDPEIVIWEGKDETLSAHLELTISARGRWTTVRFDCQLDGESPLPGLAPTDEIARLLLKGAAEYSLARLEKLAADVEALEQQRTAERSSAQVPVRRPLVAGVGTVD
jgi:hypothetical protein